MDDKATLHRYLRTRRVDLLAKLDGLDEYDARRPLTPTGTNLLGLVKHVASVQLGYFGEVFGRPSPRNLPWDAEDAESDADMWAGPEETREQIVELHRFSAEHSDATIDALPLDAPGEVPWWPEERRHVTLHQILVHMCVETAQHLGHADILRELIDGSAGQRPGDPNLTTRTPEEWAAHRSRIHAAARAAADQVRERQDLPDIK
ncbi:putative damage-inducible protein DinB [Arthrobacter sp. PvP102]|uniref:DinB family protein n=1 Tax=unclassified Arthrobacter TaxID=235627 RepID=UPI001AE9C0BF|nr:MULTISPECIES: DinB family protein [unclassified Arthrobacter]MBP1233244.1 putative damage-inducible protein DinB [Arthrobacter sp. PvP103]MBP1238379.1 putative damage-inducible protein DinB [Arthrobacter sp. PvP102]